ncbi:integrase arm-type DNA-binding domain-containing protein [Xanthobacter autotrophicus]|uniref:Integrase arm-type DNA-binding domain-containing protein n=1 Tax=Xanthobacter dioxanivorans TaxID=2528964 RepID=A0A974PUT9_9HYPH|nr:MULTISPECIES: site-specific integrase [Xanthobacter]QRG10184.1 integrase arm-type DNA-binding domain-containing protein [Xanthobacter dioxanivorans]UDQ88582.1 integrase arm-type DNA-binding domain-containing protein [Xanthobacter autotrophicus]
MPLSDVAVRAAKPQPKPVKLSDGGGLQLLVTPMGGKLWRLAYRFDGKQKQLALGAYPAVGLADARKARDAAKATLAAGVDPSEKAKVDRAARKVASANTFGAIADELIAKMERERKAVRTIAKVTWLLGIARPDLGQRPIADITAAEVLRVLKAVDDRGNHETAKRLRATIGGVFRYAIATTRAENDPTYALKGALTAPTVTHRAAITDPKGLGALLRAIESFDGQPTTRAALRLMPILFPRPGELRMAEWAEFDLEKAEWTIPASRMKMRRPHRSPLPRQAIEILRELHAITGRGKLPFHSVRTVLRPISENTLNAALRRLGYAKDEVTAHGFRATASTLLNESGLWHADAIERQLAHIEADDVRRAYLRGEHWDERVRMMQWWADHLDALATKALEKD